jgi:hypothetical protein
MSFEKLEVLVASGRRGMPASVTLSGRDGGGRPALKIVLSASFATQAKISGGEKFDLLIGTGEEAGVVRLVRNVRAGILDARAMAKGGISFFCGHVERLGTEPQEKRFCAAEIIDADTIEVTLPPWALE